MVDGDKCAIIEYCSVTQEKDQAVDRWQTLLQEHDRLQQQYQERLTETQILVTERKKQNVIFIYFSSFLLFSCVYIYIHAQNMHVHINNRVFELNGRKSSVQ